MIGYEKAPAQTWLKLSKLYCADKISMHIMGDELSRPVSVPTGTFGSHLVTCTSVLYRPYNQNASSVLYLQKLVPAKKFDDTVYLNTAEYSKDKDSSGYYGFKVQNQNRAYVCSGEIQVSLTLPTTMPVSLDDAIAFELSEWKRNALGYQCSRERDKSRVEWKMWNFHPVACYGALKRLHWHDGAKMQYLPLDVGINLDEITESTFLPVKIMPTTTPQQLSLF